MHVAKRCVPTPRNEGKRNNEESPTIKRFIQELPIDRIGEEVHFVSLS